jgi:hypothetical protein
VGAVDVGGDGQGPQRVDVHGGLVVVCRGLESARGLSPTRSRYHSGVSWTPCWSNASVQARS